MVNCDCSALVNDLLTSIKLHGAVERLSKLVHCVEGQLLQSPHIDAEKLDCVDLPLELELLQQVHAGKSLIAPLHDSTCRFELERYDFGLLIVFSSWTVLLSLLAFLRHL